MTADAGAVQVLRGVANLPMLLLVTLAARLPFLGRPGFAIDLALYRGWADTATLHGLGALYRRTDYDYPPVYSYVLWLIGQIHYHLLGRDFSANDRVLLALLKTPAILADLAIVAVLYLVIQQEAGRVLGFAGALAYALNPAVVHDSVVWGQVDAVMALPMLLSVVALHRFRPALASAMLVLAVLVKFQAIVLLPLFVIVVWRKGRGRALLRAGLAGALVGVLVMLPVALTGELNQMLRVYVQSTGIHPFVSMNAYNVWWIVNWFVTGNPNMTLHDSSSLLGPISYKLTGLLLCGGALAAVLLTAARRPLTLSLIGLTSSASAIVFFALAPEMHERYLLPALPLLVLAFRDVQPRLLFALFSVTLFLNLDWVLRSSFGEHWSVLRLIGTGVLSVANTVGVAWTLLLLIPPEWSNGRIRAGLITGGLAVLVVAGLALWTVSRWYVRDVM
jgi:Gpi18-like mannosyltransferase